MIEHNEEDRRYIFQSSFGTRPIVYDPESRIFYDPTVFDGSKPIYDDGKIIGYKHRSVGHQYTPSPINNADKSWRLLKRVVGFANSLINKGEKGEEI